MMFNDNFPEIQVTLFSRITKIKKNAYQSIVCYSASIQARAATSYSFHVPPASYSETCL